MKPGKIRLAHGHPTVTIGSSESRAARREPDGLETPRRISAAGSGARRIASARKRSMRAADVVNALQAIVVHAKDGRAAGSRRLRESVPTPSRPGKRR
jgi:hypothetical protein